MPTHIRENPISDKFKDYKIARNILAQKQFTDIADEFNKNNISFIPIKGIALLNLVYKDTAERFMEDVDILVKEKDLVKIHSVMTGAGYSPVPDEPLAWTPSCAGAPIDLHTDIWYLSKKEMREIWDLPLSVEFDGIKCRVLPKEDMIIHAIAHSFIHHGQNNDSWKKDVLAMFAGWEGSLDLISLMGKLSEYELIAPFGVAFDILKAELPGRTASIISYELEYVKDGKQEKMLMKFIDMRHNLKGHILRFLFLRDLNHQVRYIFKALFPSPYIMGRRYNKESGFGIACAYVWRPISFVVYTFQVFIKFIFRR